MIIESVSIVKQPKKQGYATIRYQEPIFHNNGQPCLYPNGVQVVALKFFDASFNSKLDLKSPKGTDDLLNTFQDCLSSAISAWVQAGKPEYFKYKNIT